jgi:CopG family nickel-responsive transcriptional regulator
LAAAGLPNPKRPSPLTLGLPGAVARLCEMCHNPSFEDRGKYEAMRQDDTLRRFGVSMEDSLLAEFDGLISRKGYATRSEAFRDLARAALAEEVLADESAEAVATVSLVYDHDVPNLTSRLTEVQHHALELIASTLHVHLDASRCLEVLVVRGPFGRVRELADNLISIKGVKYGKFVTTTGLPRPTEEAVRNHGHRHGKGKAARR